MTEKPHLKYLGHGRNTLCEMSVKVCKSKTTEYGRSQGCSESTEA